MVECVLWVRRLVFPSMTAWFTVLAGTSKDSWMLSLLTAVTFGWVTAVTFGCMSGLIEAGLEARRG